MSKSRYKLARGSQVRREDFGLLFYKMNGPRLYFVSSGKIISPDFFGGDMTLEEWIDKNYDDGLNEDRIYKLRKILGQLCEKGVIIEC
jgi:putative mycofactocin binding protein MftB